jgi:tetratricopeptide (TPR) repeat protein
MDVNHADAQVPSSGNLGDQFAQPMEQKVECWEFTDRRQSGREVRYRLEKHGSILTLISDDPSFGERQKKSSAPKVLLFLQHLVQRAGEPWPREEILDTLWSASGKAILDTYLGKLRDLLDDDGAANRRGDVLSGRIIESVSGGALRFAPDVRTPCDSDTRDTVPEDGIPQRFRAWTLPIATGYFTGRDTFISELHQALQETRGVLVTAGGGCGKTQASIEYVNKFAEAYEDVLWIPAADTPSLFARAREVAATLGLPSQSDMDVQRSCRRWMSEHPKALVVFDSLDDPALAKPFWPTGPASPSFLVTSRRTDLDELGDLHRMELLPWDEAEAVEFLVRRTKTSDQTESNRDAMRALATETGFWPLALEQAAAFIAVTKTTFASYLNNYQRLRVAIFSRDDHRPVAGDYTIPVTVTWKTSLGTLPAAAADLLAAASHLAPTLIPLELFIDAPELLTANLKEALTEVNSVDPMAVLVGSLQRYSLIQVDRDSKTFSIHKLLHEVMRADQSASKQSEWIARWIRIFVQFLPDLPSDTMFQHSEPYSRLCGAFEELFIRTQAHFPEHPSLVSAAKIAGTYVDHFYARGRPRDAETLVLPAIQVVERAMGSEHPDTLHLLEGLSVLYVDQGRYTEAEPKIARVIEGLKQAKGTEHPETLNSLKLMARLKMRQGRYAEAQPLYEHVLEVGGRVLGPTHPDTLNTLNQLAALFVHQGRYAEAGPLQRRALEGRELVLGTDHPDTLTSLNNLAELLVREGKYSQAEPLYSRVFEGRERVLGIDHPDTLASLNNLGGIYSAEGRHADAEPLVKRALGLSERLLGADHPDTVAECRNLAALCSYQGRYVEAEALFVRVLASRTRVLGPDDPNTIGSTSDLAMAYGNLGRYAEAEVLAEKAFHARSRVLGADHPDTISSLDDLGTLYGNQGRYVEAEPLFIRCLEARERVLGPDHPSVLTSLSNLTILYINHGKYAEAEPLSERTLKTRTRVLGADHPDTIQSLCDHATLYINLGRNAQAEPLVEQALEASEQVLGVDHPYTIGAIDNLAVLYINQRRYQEAEVWLKKAFAVRERALGAEHPDTIEALSSLTSAYVNNGSYREAEPLAQRALEASERVLGADHPTTLRALTNKASVLSNQANYDEAEVFFQRACEVRERVFGADHPERLVSLYGLAQVWIKQGRHGEAKELSQRILEVSQRVLGTDHPLTISIDALYPKVPGELLARVGSRL